jgi:hypothetical protein
MVAAATLPSIFPEELPGAAGQQLEMGEGSEEQGSSLLPAAFFANRSQFKGA